MKYSTELIPYREFWMNCILNSSYSIATSIEQSYSYAAYMNSYSYTSWEAFMDADFMTPTIEVLHYADNWEEFVLSKVIEKETPVFFQNPNEFLIDLKKIISDQKLVKLNVDLFYWLPNSIAWEKFHMSHYAIVNGFDNETKMFSVLDDDINGYGVHLIPEERVIKAFMNSYAMVDHQSKLPHAYIYEIRENVKPYLVDESEVMQNAKRLIEEVSEFSFHDLWSFKEEKKEGINDYISVSLIGINIIENRHLGNEFLINSLLELGIIKDSTHLSMKNHLKKIQTGWKGIKQIFINKMVSDDKDMDLELLRGAATKLLMIEKEMWKTLLDKELVS